MAAAARGDLGARSGRRGLVERPPHPRRPRGGGTLRGAGRRVLFATNNSTPTRAELKKRLAHCGITADDTDLLSSAAVAAGLLAPGTTAVVLGEDGVLEALADRGVTVVPEGPADSVVVGWTRPLHLRRPGPGGGRRAGRRPLRGHQRGRHLPHARRADPRRRLIVAAVATAVRAPGRGGRQAVPAHGRRHRGPHPAGELRVMVGDRPSTDGALAAQLDIPFALVLSWVTPPHQIPADADAAATAADLPTLVRETLAAD